MHYLTPFHLVITNNIEKFGPAAASRQLSFFQILACYQETTIGKTPPGLQRIPALPRKSPYRHAAPT
jgi:hypothetical protein